MSATSRTGALLAVVLVASACLRDPAGAALEPRYVAIHNALAALGMTEVGPIREGVLAQGRQARVALGVLSACTTVAVVGGGGVSDIDAMLVDSAGHPQAHDTTSEPQAVVHVCPESSQWYDLVVRAAAGAGPWVAAAFQGGSVPARAELSPRAQGEVEKQGTCEAPIPLAEGTVTGSTVHGEHDYEGSCAPSDAREMVYRLDVSQRANVTLDLESHFDAVLYVRSGDCADGDSEIACDDDSPDQTHSRVSQVFEPGTYFVFVDGYTREGGSFKLTVTVADALSRLEQCGQASWFPLGQAVSSTTEGRSDSARATCGGGAEGADGAWRFEVPARSRIRMTEHADSDFAPVLHMRRACAEQASEVACSDTGIAPGDATVIGVFDPGAYFAFADTRDKDSAGPYVLLSEVASIDGEGTAPSDGCADAAALRSSPVSGDTFAARDDVASSCGGAGAPDVVYRVDVARRSRFVASIRTEESSHVLSVLTRCGDRSTELACGSTVDDVLAAGSYFFAVDGAREDAFGRFTVAWHLQDLSPQTGACAGAPDLVAGRALTSTTAGAGNRFSASCSGGGSGVTGPDRVYRMVLRSRLHVRVSLRTQGFDAVLALRKACADGAGSQRAAEVDCVPSAPETSSRRATIDRTLEPGSYWVLVDGQSTGQEGTFSLNVDEIR
ncbi:MAG: hypothetical protein ABTD50_11845 [Polyangiaceae bacterium]